MHHSKVYIISQFCRELPDSGSVSCVYRWTLEAQKCTYSWKDGKQCKSLQLITKVGVLNISWCFMAMDNSKNWIDRVAANTMLESIEDLLATYDNISQQEGTPNHTEQNASRTRGFFCLSLGLLELHARDPPHEGGAVPAAMERNANEASGGTSKCGNWREDIWGYAMFTVQFTITLIWYVILI